MKKSISAGAAILSLLLLLSHPALSFQGASQGLLLWFHTVLPTLLPFMLCSNVIVMLDGISLLTAPFRPVLKTVLRLSPEGGYVLISGLLCGYPMGAKTCSEFLARGQITEAEANYLLAISNHPSPMFLLGYVAAGLSPAVPVGRILLALYLPLFGISWMARCVYIKGQENDRAAQVSAVQALSVTGTREDTHCCPASGIPEATNPPAPVTFDDLMLTSLEVMVRIGGYIMIFSILAVFIQNLPGISPLWKAFFLGVVEITTGIQAISKAVSGPMQGFLLVIVIAFGGLSGIFQTKSVLKADSEESKNAGLSIRHYILWKLIHALLSGILYLIFLLACNQS